MKNFQLFFVLSAILTLGIGNAWAEEVTYTITSATSVTAKGESPMHSIATFKNTNTTGNGQELTKGKSMTLTLSGFDGYTITGLTLSMKSEDKNATGSLSMNVGSVTVATIEDSKFVDSYWNGSIGEEFVSITPSVMENLVGEGENIV